MLETIKNRRDDLKEELVRAQARLNELERAAASLRETMLRIRCRNGPSPSGSLAGWLSPL